MKFCVPYITSQSVVNLDSYTHKEARNSDVDCRNYVQN